MKERFLGNKNYLHIAIATGGTALFGVFMLLPKVEPIPSFDPESPAKITDKFTQSLYNPSTFAGGDTEYYLSLRQCDTENPEECHTYTKEVMAEVYEDAAEGELVVFSELED